MAEVISAEAPMTSGPSRSTTTAPSSRDIVTSSRRSRRALRRLDGVDRSRRPVTQPLHLEQGSSGGSDAGNGTVVLTTAAHTSIRPEVPPFGRCRRRAR